PAEQQESVAAQTRPTAERQASTAAKPRQAAARQASTAARETPAFLTEAMADPVNPNALTAHRSAARERAARSNRLRLAAAVTCACSPTTALCAVGAITTSPSWGTEQRFHA